MSKDLGPPRYSLRTLAQKRYRLSLSTRTQSASWQKNMSQESRVLTTGSRVNQDRADKDNRQTNGHRYPSGRSFTLIRDPMERSVGGGKVAGGDNRASLHPRTFVCSSTRLRHRN